MPISIPTTLTDSQLLAARDFCDAHYQTLLETNASERVQTAFLNNWAAIDDELVRRGLMEMPE